MVPQVGPQAGRSSFLLPVAGAPRIGRPVIWPLGSPASSRWTWRWPSRTWGMLNYRDCVWRLPLCSGRRKTALPPRLNFARFRCCGSWSAAPREIAAAAPSFHLDSVLPEEQASSTLAIWLKAPMSTIQSGCDATGLCDGVTLGWSASRCLVMIGRHDAGGEGDRLGGRGRIARLLKGSQRVMAGWPARRCRLPNIRCCRPLAVRSHGSC